MNISTQIALSQVAARKVAACQNFVTWCRGVASGARGSQCPGCRISGRTKKSEQRRKYFPWNTRLHSLSENFRFKGGYFKLVSCSGRHLTSVRSWHDDIAWHQGGFGDFRKKTPKCTWLCAGISPLLYGVRTWSKRQTTWQVL